MKLIGLYIIILILAEALLPAPGIEDALPGFWDAFNEETGYMVSRYGFYLPLDEYRFVFWKEIALLTLGAMALWYRARRSALEHENESLREIVLTRKTAAEPASKPVPVCVEVTGDMEPAVNDVEEPVIVPSNEVLEAVRVARCTCQEIRFLYRDLEGRVTERRVRPLEIYHRDGHSYVRGWCSLRRDERTFRIDRMVLMASQST